MILRVQVGSGVHGTAMSGQDDRDEMGVCLEPPEFMRRSRGCRTGPGARCPSVPFGQYERHTAWDRPGGVAERSGAGDLDVVIYSARKWARLALDGNPTVLLVLFVPAEEVVFRNEAGAELVANAHRFVSARAAARFLGYLRGQEARITGHSSRPELVAAHGFDTKHAMHALRLGLQGTGRWPPAGSRCRYPSRTAPTCGRSGGARSRWRRCWRRSARRRHGWRHCATAPASPSSRTGRGWTAGCTVATWTSGPGSYGRQYLFAMNRSWAGNLVRISVP